MSTRNNLFSRFALVVGVDDLPSMTRDAEALQHRLIDFKRSDIPSQNVKKLSPAECTATGILNGLEWLRRRVEESSEEQPTAIIYYSGHGGEAPHGSNQYYLKPRGFDEARPAETGVSAERLAEMLRAIRQHAGRTVTILDCCHAAALNTATKGNESVDDADSLPPVEKLYVGEGDWLLFACSNDQKALPGEAPGQVLSVFTECLLEALDGRAANREGLVCMFDLIRYLKQTVPEKAHKYRPGHRQNPTYHVSGREVDFAISRAPMKVGSGRAVGLSTGDSRKADQVLQETQALGSVRRDATHALSSIESEAVLRFQLSDPRSVRAWAGDRTTVALQTAQALLEGLDGNPQQRRWESTRADSNELRLTLTGDMKEVAIRAGKLVANYYREKDLIHRKCAESAISDRDPSRSRIGTLSFRVAISMEPNGKHASHALGDETLRQRRHRKWTVLLLCNSDEAFECFEAERKHPTEAGVPNDPPYTKTLNKSGLRLWGYNNEAYLGPKDAAPQSLKEKIHEALFRSKTSLPTTVLPLLLFTSAMLAYPGRTTEGALLTLFLGLVGVGALCQWFFKSFKKRELRRFLNLVGALIPQRFHTAAPKDEPFQPVDRCAGISAGISSSGYSAYETLARRAISVGVLSFLLWNVCLAVALYHPSLSTLFEGDWFDRWREATHFRFLCRPFVFTIITAVGSASAYWVYLQAACVESLFAWPKLRFARNGRVTTQPPTADRRYRAVLQEDERAAKWALGTEIGSTSVICLAVLWQASAIDGGRFDPEYHPFLLASRLLPGTNYPVNVIYIIKAAIMMISLVAAFAYAVVRLGTFEREWRYLAKAVEVRRHVTGGDALRAAFGTPTSAPTGDRGPVLSPFGHLLMHAYDYYIDELSTGDASPAPHGQFTAGRDKPASEDEL